MTGIEPPSHWSATERAVWDALSAGRPADVDAIVGGTAPGINDDAGWAAATDRALSKRFVEDLFSAAYAASLQRDVAFIGARFESDLVIRGGITAGLTLVLCRLPGLFLWQGRIAGSVRLSQTRVTGHVLILDVDVKGDVGIAGGRIDHTLKLLEIAVGGSVSIRPEGVAGPDDEPPIIADGLSISNATVRRGMHVRGVVTDGRFDVVASTVNGDLSLGHSRFSSLDFTRSQIQGQIFLHDNDVAGGIDLEHAVVSGWISWIRTGGAKATLSAEDLTVGRNMRISDSTLAVVDIDRAAITGDVMISKIAAGPDLDAPSLVARRVRVGGNLLLKDCRFGQAALNSTRVEGDASVDGCTFAASVDGTAMHVGGTLSLGNTELPRLDLTGATIGRDLSLLSWIGKEPRWQPGAQLSLRNATADAVCDSEGAWPDALDLEGFAFKRIASHGFAYKPLPARDSTSLIAWLARDPNASAQPYVQLARVLREAGQIVKANDILYAARERERVQARRSGHQWKAASLWVLRATMGYGLGTARFFRAFWWVAGFVLAGVAVLHLDQHVHGHALAAKSRTLAWMLFASLDAMLPIVSLDSSFSRTVPAELASIWSKAFFWLQGLVGWVLGAFLAAGLAGLTQRPN